MKYFIYPLIFGAGAAAIVVLGDSGFSHWLLLPIVIAVGGSLVLLLEKNLPYHAIWNVSVGDFVSDALHNIVNFGLMAFIFIAFAPIVMHVIPGNSLWPQTLPFWAQVLIAGLVIDLGMYTVHRLSHTIPILWNLHSIHHSSKRIYWLNGEKRHPIHAVLEGTPGLIALAILKANPQAVYTWFIILNLHLMFQHGNIDYRAGILKYIFSVAELHRWHHRGDYADAQVNYGAVFSFWDYLFSSAFKQASDRPIREKDVGIFEEPNFPQDYLGQLRKPFA